MSSTVLVDAGRGNVTVYVPDTHDPGTSYPLVLGLHGYGGDETIAETRFRFDADGLVDSHEILWAVPEGSLNEFGTRYWEGTDYCCDFFREEPGDIAYLEALILAIDTALNVDNLRVYAVGTSNGGAMCYALACAKANRMAAIIPVAAPNYSAGKCSPSEPVSVLHIMGTDDNTFEYEGGVQFAVPFASALTGAEEWATHNGCALTQDTSQPDINLVTEVGGTETSRIRWASGCSAGTEVELWSMNGAGHVATFAAGVPEILLDWLLAHPKQFAPG